MSAIEDSNIDARTDVGSIKAIEILKQNPLVYGSEDIANSILSCSTERTFKRNDVLIRQNATDDSVYFLLQGEVEVGIAGKTRTVTRAAPMQVGEMAALNPTDARSATVRAIDEKVVVREISARDFNDIGEKFPDFLTRALVEQNNRNKAWKASGTESVWFERLISSKNLALASAFIAALIFAVQLMFYTSVWVAAGVFFATSAVLLFLSFWLNRTRFLLGCFTTSGLSTLAYLTNPFIFRVEGRTENLTGALASQPPASIPSLITLVLITVIFGLATVYSWRHES